jgi:anti-sigma regulatory factor (Ser/Thr protein kinase)
VSAKRFSPAEPGKGPCSPAAEALTNVAKHAHADLAEARARVENGALEIGVRDHGIAARTGRWIRRRGTAER